MTTVLRTIHKTGHFYFGITFYFTKKLIPATLVLSLNNIVGEAEGKTDRSLVLQKGMLYSA